MSAHSHIRIRRVLLIATACGAACACLFVGLLPRAATAQYSMVEPLSHRFEWSGRIATDFLNEFETETDGGDEFRAWRLGVSGDVGGPVNESILMGFRARYQHAEYEFHHDNGPGQPPVYRSNELPRDPWNGIDTIDLMPTTTILIGSRVWIEGGVPIRWSGEVGTRSNAWSAGVSAILGWQVTDRFSAGLGIGVTSQLEDDAEAFPLIQLDWQVTDRLQVATRGSWIQGGATALAWQPNDTLGLSLSVGYERNRFRLDDNGNARDKNGIGEITSIPIELGLRVNFAKGVHVDVRAGLAVAGRFRIETSAGKKLFDQEYDPAPRLGISLTIPIGGTHDSGAANGPDTSGY